jgi:hypothetical protein
MALKTSLTLSAHLGSLMLLLLAATGVYAGLIVVFRKNEYLRLKHVLFG